MGGPETSFPNRGLRLAAVSAGGLAMLTEQWQQLGIRREVICEVHGEVAAIALDPGAAEAWMPGFKVFDLASVLGLRVSEQDDDLLREIWLTLLNSPVPREFPSVEELMAAVRMRLSLVRNSERTYVRFDSAATERPADCWSYSEETGFILNPGCSLVESLRKACQPGRTGPVYAFSCSRATEYVMLLAIAEEAERSNRSLLRDLESQWRLQAIQAGQFRHAFAEEYGSLEQPLPLDYYVPGDRVWFRNPDRYSFEAKGFEGSWMFYLGGGMFANFWKRDLPFTLLRVCVRIFHWREGARLDENGEWQVDEPEVERLAAETLADPAQSERVFHRMHRLRDPGGVFAEGGCMDATRESPRFVLQPHCDMMEQLRNWS